MGDEDEGVENRLEVFEELSQVMDLYEGSPLSSPVYKEQRTLIATINRSLGVDRCHMASVTHLATWFLIISSNFFPLARNVTCSDHRILNHSTVQNVCAITHETRGNLSKSQEGF